jgi:uncharacterized SAM-binding protein YcdF (DUF218 family)
VPVIVGLAALYFILFYTPFIWWVAEPLRMEGHLKKADAIIVFAGGVGESGKAGQGYEERVKYAVELYKGGLADHIVFSSGYSYAFKETNVMKALAVSLEVPPDRIILEDRAGSTYENVLYSSEIMDKNGWRSAVVVSSPYNMRRAVSVWKKARPQYEIIAAPIKDSIFFGDKKKVKVEHIQAILHEYAGLLFYKLKGYL